MSQLRWWPLPAAAIYSALTLATWAINGRQAFAASSLDGRGFGDFQPLEPRKVKKAAGAGQEKGVTFQKIQRVPSGYVLQFGFRNFNKDALRLQAELDAQEVAGSIAEFGFKQSDFDKLDAWFQESQKLAIARAEKQMAGGKVTAATQAELDRKMNELNAKNAAVQRALDAELARLKGEYGRRRVEIYEAAGFKFRDKSTVEADIPTLARRNWKRVRPVADGFNEIVDERSYDSEELVGAATAWVQTALRYEIPETKEGSRVIAGVLPPLKALVLGQGDCDTKTALLSSVLMNWPNLKIVGLGIPEHYLMAVHRIPRRGEVFIEFEGLPYVMIESAGPAWLAPGTVGDSTLAYLQAGHDFRIQPMSSRGG